MEPEEWLRAIDPHGDFAHYGDYKGLSVPSDDDRCDMYVFEPEEESKHAIDSLDEAFDPVRDREAILSRPQLRTRREMYDLQCEILVTAIIPVKDPRRSEFAEAIEKENEGRAKPWFSKSVECRKTCVQV
jgi:hypothetical protein